VRALLVPGLICLLALGLRLGYLLFTGHYPLTSDAAFYNEIAHNLASGHGFSQQYPQTMTHETAFRPPLYPMLLAAFYWVFGPHAGLARGINVVIGVGVVAMTFLVVQRGISRTAAVWAAFAVAIMPNLIANDTFALDEPLCLLLILVMIDLLLRSRWAWAGAVTGLLVLARPSAQFLALALALWVLVHAGWRKTLLFLAVAVLVVAPWSVRNWIQLGTPMVTTSNGFNWAAEYSPPALANPDRPFTDATTDPFFAPYAHLLTNEAAWDSALERLSIRTLLHNPTHVFRVVARGAGDLFDATPQNNVLGEEDDGRDMSIVNATFSILWVEMGLGVVGLALRWRNRCAHLFMLEGGYFLLASLLFISVPRLRAPVDLMLAVGVGCCIDWVVVAVRRFAPSRARPVHAGAS
jgi:4-amino-4-deoxy-L-arabinose transferase-like glycosyltransferase